MMNKEQMFQRLNQWWMTYGARQQGRGVEHRELARPSTAEPYRLFRQRLRERGHGREGHDAR
jgi:hypothetical protein